MKSLEAYLELLRGFYENVRTEAVAAELIDSGIEKGQLLSRSVGQHKRVYSRDLDGVKEELFKNQEEKIVFELNRDGLYDSLPEALFHKTQAKKTSIRSNAMVDEYRQRKEEETQVRNFFGPLEHEFFFSRVLNELDERDAFFNMAKFRFSDDIVRFFNIDTLLPVAIQTKLLCLLPVANRFKGNFFMVEKIISLLIGCPVRHVIANEITATINQARLGSTILGADLTLRNLHPDMDVKVKFCIGPVLSDKIYDFLPEKILDRLMTLIFNQYIPVEYTASYSIETGYKNSLFVLNENDTSTGRLAYTTTL